MYLLYLRAFWHLCLHHQRCSGPLDYTLKSVVPSIRFMPSVMNGLNHRKAAWVSWSLERWDSDCLEPCPVYSQVIVDPGPRWEHVHMCYFASHSDSVDEVILGMIDMNEPMAECWRMYHLLYPCVCVCGKEFKDWGMSIIYIPKSFMWEETSNGIKFSLWGEII